MVDFSAARRALARKGKLPSAASLEGWRLLCAAWLGLPAYPAAQEPKREPRLAETPAPKPPRGLLRTLASQEARPAR